MWKMNGKVTRGEEYNNGIPIPNTTITHGNCEYCGTEIIEVRDDYFNKFYGALGNQAVRPGIYFGSKAIQTIKQFYQVGWIDLDTKRARKNGNYFSQELGNNLYNVHSRLHVHEKGSRKLIGPWRFANQNSFKVLCNNCFKKTYRRVSVNARSGLVYDVTVLPGETLRGVLQEIGVDDAMV